MFHETTFEGNRPGVFHCPLIWIGAAFSLRLRPRPPCVRPTCEQAASVLVPVMLTFVGWSPLSAVFLHSVTLCPLVINTHLGECFRFLFFIILSSLSFYTHWWFLLESSYYSYDCQMLVFLIASLLSFNTFFLVTRAFSMKSILSVYFLIHFLIYLEALTFIGLPAHAF